MKMRLSPIVLISVFLIGLSLLLYPTVSDYINYRHQSRAITSYEEKVSDLNTMDYSAYWQAAFAYNQNLADNPDRFLNAGEDEPEYEGLLNPMGNGIMGYVEIDSIGVKLPIYHGTDNAVLQVGAGHLEGSSLPVGGENTHCVLSGHRGLPSASLFTNLDKLAVGDVFSLHVLDQILVYQVDQILIVEPTDTKDLEIIKGKDYCTLITCTPYGINSHRLLVRGMRISYDEKTMRALQVTADAMEIDSVLVAPVFSIPILIVLFIRLLVSTGIKRPKMKKRGKRR